MSRKKRKADYESSVPMVRMVLGYIWLIALFGSVLFIVQAAIEVRRTHYHMTDKYNEKVALLDDLRRLDQKILELESYERIEAKVRESLPQLGPPRHPAISIPVNGLIMHRGLPTAVTLSPEETSWILNVRDRWTATSSRIKQWAKQALE
ncbi:MAG: hypothetical protein P9L94_11360 [Candidatus Hinthialibacter antarcticus]|nr:hypothetical protein [Candidatus Hinthialibacter antarcticus]